MRAVLDTSVLISDEPAADVKAAISVASLAELHFGVQIAADDDERALRTQRLGAIECTFDPLPITADIAREWGRLAAAVSTRGGQPRRRAIDLAIAATANVEGVPPLTPDAGDFEIIGDLTEPARHHLRNPARQARPSPRQTPNRTQDGAAGDPCSLPVLPRQVTRGGVDSHRRGYVSIGPAKHWRPRGPRAGHRLPRPARPRPTQRPDHRAEGPRRQSCLPRRTRSRDRQSTGAARSLSPSRGQATRRAILDQRQTGSTPPLPRSTNEVAPLLVGRAGDRIGENHVMSLPPDADVLVVGADPLGLRSRARPAGCRGMRCGGCASARIDLTSACRVRPNAGAVHTPQLGGTALSMRLSTMRASSVSLPRTRRSGNSALTSSPWSAIAPVGAAIPRDRGAAREPYLGHARLVKRDERQALRGRRSASKVPFGSRVDLARSRRPDLPFTGSR
jgi:toxin FitB